MNRHWHGGIARGNRPLPPFITPHRAAILELSIQGLRDAQIGKLLGISRGAVSSNLYHMRESTGTSSTSELIYMALRLGWFTVEVLPFNTTTTKP